MSPRRRSDDLELHPRATAAARRSAPTASSAAGAPASSSATIAIAVVIASLSAGLGAGRRALRELRPQHPPAGRDRPELVRLRATTARCSARSPPSGTASPSRTRQMSTLAAACDRSRSRTAASTQHGGVDYVGIARAAWKDVTAGKVVEGGSTITQQLVRNLYTGQEKTFTRKIKEACLAIKLSSKWPKSKILNEYLNTVYYGNHAYGVEAASQTYFSKPAIAADAAAVGAARRTAAGAVGLRPVPQSAGGARPPRRGAARDAHERRASRSRQYDQRGQVEHARAEARPHLHAHQAAVLLLVRDRRARARSTARTPCARAG